MNEIAAKVAANFINRRHRERRMTMIRNRNEVLGAKVNEYPPEEAAALIDEMARIEVEE